MNQKQRQAKESRELFVQSAYRLIEEKGYHNVTVQDICQRAGKSIGAFYYHFSTKEDVIIAAYKEFDDYLEENYRLDDFENWKKAVAYLLDSYLEYTVKNGLEFSKASIIAQLSISNTYMTNPNRFFYQCMTDALSKGQRQLSKSEVDSQCNWLMRTVRGSIFAWVVHGGEPSLLEMGKSDYLNVLDSLG